MSDDERAANRQDQNIDNEKNQFRDQPYYASKEYDLGNIQVPLLSVANWGGILLHLRGNVEGYTHAGSKLKYLRFITGRHDLPFYYHEEVELQRSFLDAFLKGEDRVGWATPGKVPPVDILLRKGDKGFNDAAREQEFPRRQEMEWPIARTKYTPYYLTPENELVENKPEVSHAMKVSYEALGTLEKPQLLQFSTPPVKEEIEITGHIVARLNVSTTAYVGGTLPRDIDLFVTLRHISPEGKEVFYTGTAGDNVPLCKGWLRVSMRKVNNEHYKHREWLPYRDYYSTDVLPVLPGEVYPVDVEVWPTNVVLEPGAKLIFEVSSGDTQGCGIFQHKSPVDRAPDKLAGKNHLHFGPKFVNYLTLPVIPRK